VSSELTGLLADALVRRTLVRPESVDSLDARVALRLAHETRRDRFLLARNVRHADRWLAANGLPQGPGFVRAIVPMTVWAPLHGTHAPVVVALEGWWDGWPDRLHHAVMADLVSHHATLIWAYDEDRP
jgi:hypothetical protein